MSQPTPNATPDRAATTTESTPGRRLGPITVGRAIALMAAAGLLAGVAFAPMLGSRGATAADPTTSPEHTVTVSGSGDVSIAPDVADLSLGVSVQKPTAAAAQASAATSMTEVIAAIKKNGVDDKDIVTTNVSLSPVYDYTNSSAPRLTGYQFSNTVKVTIRKLASIAAVVDDSVAGGATTVYGISFRVGDPKAAEAKARQLAMADARARADALASAAGTSVRGVATISEVATQPSPVYYASSMDSGKGASLSTPIQTGSTDVIVQVTVSYLIG
jgi:uncharacterized protein YggE